MVLLYPLGGAPWFFHFLVVVAGGWISLCAPRRHWLLQPLSWRHLSWDAGWWFSSMVPFPLRARLVSVFSFVMSFEGGSCIIIVVGSMRLLAWSGGHWLLQLSYFLSGSPGKLLRPFFLERMGPGGPCPRVGGDGGGSLPLRLERKPFTVRDEHFRDW